MRNYKDVHWRKKVTRILFMLIICGCELFALEYSSMNVDEWCFAESIRYCLINFALVTLPNLILTLILRNVVVSLLITGFLSTLWSIVNYYVILFHGSPLSISTLVNIGTALNVMRGYKISLNTKVICILGIFFIELAVIGILKWAEKREKCPLNNVFYLIILGLNFCFIYVCLFSSYAIKPQNTIGWSWTDSVERYGYLCYLVEDAGNTLYPIVKPEGYAIDLLDDVQLQENLGTFEKPDIILILNESFCDLSEYTEMETDTDYLEAFYGIEGATYGHAIVPTIGGGTNNSEYELLTANSMYLLSADAPFNYLNLERNKNNFVEILNSLGYETCGMHCAVPTNYSRNTAYQALGMDHVLLGRKNFDRLQYYGERPWLDWDNYQDMIELYEKLEDNPRFMYLLTYQNHGGYEQNGSEFDTVHTTLDYGNLTDDVDEYLTSIKMSAEAFRALVEYYAKVERPVIICMVGDHAPSFITELPINRGLSIEQRGIAERSVPFVIWSNYDIKINCYTESVSMTDLSPIIMKIAGLPLTHYYQAILELHEDIPVRTSDGMYMKKDGTIEKINADSKYYQKIMEYYYLEYNALNGGKDYKKKYFEFGDK